MGESLLPRAEVERRCGFKRSKLYMLIAAGTFPKPLRDPATGAVRWLESEVDAWVAEAVKTWPRGGTVAGSRAESVKKAA